MSRPNSVDSDLLPTRAGLLLMLDNAYPDQRTDRLTRRLSHLVLAVCCIAALAVASFAQNQPQPQPQPPIAAPEENGLTTEAIEAKRTAAKESTTLDDDTKAKIEAAYKDVALKALSDASADETRAAAFDQLVQPGPQSAGDLTKQAEDELAALPTQAPPITDLLDDAPIKQVEQRLADETAKLTTLRDRLKSIDQLLQALKTRPEERAAELVANKTKLQEIETALSAKPPDGEPAELTEAKRIALQARQRWRQAEQRKLELESATVDVRQRLRTAQRALAQRQTELAQQTVDELTQRIETMRAAERQADLEAARRAAVQAAAQGKHPAIVELTEQTEQFAEEAKSVGEASKSVAEKIKAAGDQATRVEKNLQSAKEKLEALGLSGEMGQELRDQRRKLPELSVIQRQNRERDETIRQTRFRHIKVEDRLRELEDLESAVNELMAEKEIDSLPEDQREKIRADLLDKLTKQKENLEKLDKDYREYRNRLGDLATEQQRTLEQVEAYAAFLDERLLWTPSGSRLGVTTWEQMGRALRWLASPTAWRDAGKGLVDAVARWPYLVAIVAIVLTALLVVRTRLKRMIRETAKHVSKINDDTYVDALIVLGSDLLLALPIPLVMFTVGFLLRQSPPTVEYELARSAGAALMVASYLTLGLRFFGILCRDPNLGGAHFRWDAGARRMLRRSLTFLLIAIVPLAAVVTLFTAHGDDAADHSVGRASFIVVMGILSAVLARVFRPNSGVIATVVARRRKGYLWSLRYVVFAAASLLPVVMILLAGLGYYHTALELSKRLASTLGICVAALVVHDLVLRWLAVASARLAVEQAQLKREMALRASTEVAATPGGEEVTTLPKIGEKIEIDLARVNEHARKLLRASIGAGLILTLWFVWAAVLPALGILDGVNIWETVPADGETPAKYVTLGSIALLAVVILITIIATKNVPGVLEISVLRRLAMTQGTRYAVATICQYVIAAIGIFYAFHLIGIGWSQAQWLIAALGVGLGFGLQEIFANFISGIILLFERPIRVGDVVTVGETTGVVSRIRIRATTITDFDRKEFVVPNKEFVTGRLLNWTLSDKINRLVLNVGVAYGSDTNKARELMLKVCHDHPIVLEEPKPVVTFTTFGESTLDFVVRAYLPDLDNRLATMNDLHMQIDQVFREAGIEIAFPQRDLHIRSADVAVPIAHTNGQHDDGGQVGRASDTVPADEAPIKREDISAGQQPVVDDAPDGEAVT